MAEQEHGDHVERYVLLSDVPAASGPDPLGFEAVAAGLARGMLASRASTPLTLGIEGEWGSGKSSLMRRLEAHLVDDPNVTTVWFNAWTAERTSALEGLVKTVLNTLDPSVLRRSLRNQKMLSVGRAAALMAASWIGWNRVVDLAWKRVSADARTRNELRTLVEEAVTRWRDQHAGVPSGRTLVVFVDDLDRASPSQVFEVFEALKVYLDVPGLVFVVGFDRGVLAQVILDRGSIALHADAYLEKIVQASFRIPPVDETQARDLLRLYTQHSGTDDLLDDTSRALMVEHNRRNPRRVKRFLNAFVLMYSIDPEWQELGAKNLVDVLLLETHFPEFATLLRNAADADPLQEFLVYWAAKRELIAQAPDPEDESVGERIRALEWKLPEVYPMLFEDHDFVALAHAIHGSPRWLEVRRKIQRGGRIQSILPAVLQPDRDRMAAPSSEPSGSLLWIADRQEARHILDAVENDGWAVTEVRDGAAARRLLTTRTFDVVVSDLERHGNPDAGFEDLEGWRKDEIYLGPVVFFVLRVTSERRQKAEALGARITNRVDELRRFLPPAGPAGE